MKIIQITENMSHTAKRIHDIEKEKGVTPGTPEWFKLWFSLPYLKESITEAFDNPYPYNWDDVYNGDDSFLAKAEMDMGELMVMFTLGKPGVSWTIDFAVDGAMDKTGDGDQFRIFATVVAVIKDWMANKVDLSKVTQIDFSSDKGSAAEDSRSKLYKRFGQQLASKLGWNLEVTDRGQFASFKIKNPNAPAEITESMDNPYAYRWDKQLEDHWVAKADTPAGLMLVMAEWGAGDSSWTIDFAVGGRMGKSGAGDEFRIFATVVAVIKDWITKVDLSNTKLISFSADKSDDVGSSRAKLYARFARQLATQLGWKLEVTSTDDGQEQNDHFKLYKPTTVEEAVNEATEMKISDLTISDAGMAIAQSAGGGSRTDSPLTVTKLPSGHVYLVNGYHRLVDAMKSGKDTVAVEYVPYEKVEILWKQEREDDIKYGKQFNEEVEVSLHGDAKKGYVLSKIEVSGDERNAGQGTKAMQDIVDRMDKEGAIIALTPDDAFGGNKNRLIKFYKRFGFVPNKGRNKDFRFRETMIRYPQSNESVNEAFDNPYPFELIGPNDAQEFSALAQTPNGMLRMDFSSIDYDNFGIDFSVGTSMGKTEAGDEFRVFATVVAIMKKWIKTVGIESVESFEFGASKADHASDGRAKLYTRFAKQLASRLGWKLEQNTAKDDGTAFFKLTNPNPVLRDNEYWDALEEAVNEDESGLPVKTLTDLFHVGTLDASQKRDGYEGAGLSVSTHPDAWQKIARGHVTGDTHTATKEGNKFLDVHSLSNKHNEQIKQWAVKNGYLEQQETVTVSWFDDEMDDTLSQTFNSMADAKAEHDEELEHMDVKVDKGGIVPTDKLKKETRQNRIESTGVLEFVLPIFAEQQGLDGVWWQDKLDVQRYSAPRGVIVPSKIKSWNFAVNENFKDGKVKGKSRPGRVKRSGASCNGSVTELRAKAKKASGEKAKMYHWCANMKAGKKK